MHTPPGCVAVPDSCVGRICVLGTASGVAPTRSATLVRRNECCKREVFGSPNLVARRAIRMHASLQFGLDNWCAARPHASASIPKTPQTVRPERKCPAFGKHFFCEPSPCPGSDRTVERWIPWNVPAGSVTQSDAHVRIAASHQNFLSCLSTHFLARLARLRCLQACPFAC